MSDLSNFIREWLFWQSKMEHLSWCEYYKFKVGENATQFKEYYIVRSP